MANLLTETFTGADNTDLNGFNTIIISNGSWIINSNNALCQADGQLRSSVQASDADYKHTLDWYNANNYMYIQFAVRANGWNTCYLYYYQDMANEAGGDWTYVGRRIGGAEVELGSHYYCTNGAGWLTMSIEAQGSTIRGYLGATKTHEVTDTNLTSKMYAWTRAAGGQRIDNMKIDDFTVVITSALQDMIGTGIIPFAR